MPITTLPARRTRPTIAVAAAVLAVLTALGTAPATVDQVAVDEPAPTAEATEPTFAEIFHQMRQPIPEANGEGQGAVVVAAALPEEVAAVAPEVGVDPGTGVDPPIPPEAVLPEVQPVRPQLIVRGVDPASVDQISAMDGVVMAAVAEVGDVTLQTPGGPQTVTLAAVEPERFRPLTPAVTANESGVWERISAGDAAFNHDAGNQLTVPLGSTVATGDGAAGLRVGAYASNGIPPVADALVSTATGRALGLAATTSVYVALEATASVPVVADAITQAFAGGLVEVIEEPEEQEAFLTGNDAATFFESYSYVDHGDGLITIDPGWVARNIESRRLPIFTGNVTCHRQMLIQLEGALAEVEAAGLAPLIDTTDYGGCWVARHIDWRPNRPISMHAWGLAVDFNVRTNGLGAAPTMDPRIVEIFDRWGFVWGGRWSRPDGMHFELGAVLQNPATEVSQAPSTLTSQ